ncbi:prephenate dehydratase [Capnocytophaga stomatis]|uniref:prephenate dehydratase n=1 Tax=Capnocytophaga stomatis TaxID=1848904 RepID=UPI001952399B|nr:prephenate dehydratase [Capnocytophaga stomatis]GIJ95671.1 prephenate dehydratase [Capnocytophaga stomatis]
MQQRVAIQGIKGSFHYQAAQEYFGSEIAIVECNSFDKVAQSLLKNDADLAIMAIENSIAGSILPNYALIDRLNLKIIGEHYIDIQQHLMVLPGQDINQLKEVHSHPMALLQCKQFFEDYPQIKLVEDTDTASTAERIHRLQLSGIGAIGSKSAAELYQLNIIRHSIQTMKVNATRFVVLTAKNEEIDRNQANKASLKFQVHHKRGSLATILNVISDCRINMTKIQSLPVIETPWKYAFFVDIVFENYEDFEKAHKLLSIMAEDFKVLGIYKNTLK